MQIVLYVIFLLPLLLAGGDLVDEFGLVELA